MANLNKKQVNPNQNNSNLTPLSSRANGNFSRFSGESILKKIIIKKNIKI